MILRASLAAVLVAAFVGGGPARAAEGAAPVAPAQTAFYPQTADGAAARRDGRLAVIVFGADWCHDSRVLAEVLTSSEFRTEFAQHLAVTFIDVGKPQTGVGRNLDLVARLGVAALASTPALFVVGPDGTVRNSARNAVSWRNAASRKRASVLGWLRKQRAAAD